jgi:UTP--glucose-1-phosphate uridylyltransferase
MEDHFDHQFELEQALAEGGKSDLLAEVRRLADVPMVFVRQKERLGNGHAVMIARELVGNEPSPCSSRMTSSSIPSPLFASSWTSTPLVAAPCSPSSRSPGTGESLRIIDPVPVDPRTYEVKSVIEKPSADDSVNLATVGRFVVTPEIFDVLESTPPDVAVSSGLWTLSIVSGTSRRSMPTSSRRSLRLWPARWPS